MVGTLSFPEPDADPVLEEYRLSGAPVGFGIGLVDGTLLKTADALASG